MTRGEMWWADVDEPCPVVLLSQDGADKVRAIMIVPPASMKIDGIAVEVRIGAREGLPLEGVVRVALPRQGRINCSWLVTLAPAHLLERLGALSEAKLRQLEGALRRAGLAEP